VIEFVGTLPASKSILNRALIAHSFAPHLKLKGESQSRDVQLMRAAVERLLSEEPGSAPYDCGDAGTVLRFLALRLSRIEGEHTLSGSERLFSRPQKELEKILRQLGCDVELGPNFLKMRSYGWRLQGDGLFVSGHESSQFASAVLLSAWEYKSALPMSLTQKVVSEGYFTMTLRLCHKLGMSIHREGHEIVVAPMQSVLARDFTAELDVSSAFAVAALAAMGGTARILNFPERSLQPDSIFTEFFKQMGINATHEGEQFKVLRTDHWQGLRADLNGCPDLLPVLAVLCAFASSPSELRGLGHLIFKESNRLQKTQELLKTLGAGADIYENGSTTLKITPVQSLNTKEFDFDPDHDHRMAMAAALAREKGAKIQIKTPEVVDKSFPEFWQIAGQP
jgi:3-phosphoshikimate 1-carboxyvinyltransferase